VINCELAGKAQPFRTSDGRAVRFPFLIWSRRCFQAKGLADRMSVTMIAEVQYVTNADGKRTAVILSPDQYEKLLEDVHDLAVISERPGEEPITLEEMKERLIT
jgi:hypothetical protein